MSVDNKSIVCDGQEGSTKNLIEAAKNGNYALVKCFVDKGANFNIVNDNGDYPIQWAAWNGHLEIVKYLVQKGVEFNVKNRSGNSPLYWAAWGGSLGVVKYFVEKGTDINAKNNDGYTPLHEAAKNGYLDIVRYMVEKGADFNNVNKYGNTPLHEASGRGYLDVIKYLIDEKHTEVNIKNNVGNSPLHEAVKGGHMDVVKYLVEKGADFNMKNNEGNTPLYEAALNGKLDIVQYFVESGASVDTRNNSGKTSLDIAREKGYSDVIQYLAEKGNIKNIFDAARKGNVFVVKYLVEKGSDLNAMDDNGDHPLHWAALNGHLQIVKYLVEKGADYNAKNKSGNTGLHWAARSGRLGVVRYLVEKGADFDIQNREGLTALQEAARNGHLNVVWYFVEEKHVDTNGAKSIHAAAQGSSLDVIEYLLTERNTNVNIKNYDGNTPLHIAAREGHLKVVKYLTERGADLNIKNNEGNTPLREAIVFNSGSDVINYLIKTGITKTIFGAARNGNLDLVKYFIVNDKININSKDNDGKTPLHWAASNGHLDVVKYLVDQKNADIMSRDSHSAIPLHLAASNGQLDVVKYFIKDKHVDINVTGVLGNTVLHYAVLGKKPEVVKWLLNNGAGANIKNNLGNTPLSDAIDSDSGSDVAQYLLLNKDTTVDINYFNDNSVFKLAYYIKGAMEKANNKVQLSRLEELKNKLPESVKHAVFASKVCFKNVKYKEYMYAAANDLSYDKERRRVFTWIPSGQSDAPGTSDKQFIWRLQLDGNYFCISSTYFNEYLYAADEITHDADRRHLFTWIPSNNGDSPGSCGGDRQGFWKIQLTGNYVCITNTRYNEYLYAADDIKYDNERRHVFTWIPSSRVDSPSSKNKCGNDVQGWWMIEDCSSARKKRNTDKLDSKVGTNYELLVDTSTKIIPNVTRLLTVSERLDNYQLPALDDSHLTKANEIISQVGNTKYHEDKEKLTELNHPYLTEHSSNQPEILTSSGARPFSVINAFFNIVVGAVKGSSSFLCSPLKAVPWGTLENSMTESYYAAKVSNQYTDQFSDEVFVNNNVSLAFFLLQSFLNKKYPPPKLYSITPQEALASTLNIIQKFEDVVRQTAEQFEILVEDVNFFDAYLQVAGHIKSGRYSQIPNTLYLAAKEAYPENDKFLGDLKDNIEKMLDRLQMANNNGQEQSMANIGNNISYI